MSSSPASPDDDVPALRDTAGAFRIDDAVLVLRGDDRLDWLAGMVTQDVKSLRPGESRYLVIVHDKGKIIADGWVHCRSDDVFLVVPARTAVAIREHFERHIVMEDVDVSVDQSLRVVAVSGRGAESKLVPDARAVFRSDRIGWGGVDVVATDADTVVTRAQVPFVEEASWEAARLEAGYPRFGVDFDQENYVQEANLTERAVSFQKGCYIGQEVVCRLQMRGHVRRQLVSLIIEGTPPPRGTNVGDVGAVTSSAWSEKLGCSVAIAMLKWDVVQKSDHLGIGSQSARIVRRPVER